MKKTIYFKNCNTRKKASDRLKELSKKYHPDVSNEKDTGIMSAINEEYALLKLKFQKQDENRAKKQEIFGWVRDKSLHGIEKNNEEIKKITLEGVEKLLKTIVPKDKKHLRKIAVGLLADELENLNLVELGKKLFEEAGKALKLNR